MGPESGNARNQGSLTGQGGTGGGSVWTRMGGVFASPKQAFEQVADSAAVPDPSKSSGYRDKSRWWIPLIIFVGALVLMTAMSMPFTLPDQLETARTQMLERGASPEEIDRMMPVIERASGIMAVIGPVVAVVIFAFVVAWILHLCMKLFGGKGRYKQALAAFAYSLLIPALGTLIKLPMMLAKKTVYVETGPTLLFPSLEPSDRWYQFLSGLDIFTLWQIAVLSIGLAIAYKISTTKAGAVVLVLWLIFLFVFSRINPAGGGFGV